MCGRYALKSSRKAIAAWFGVDADSLPPFGENFNVAPQTFQPVVRLSPDTGEREVVLLRWGLIPVWANSARDGALRFNARAEDLATKPSFRDALRRRRCLVPADAFYEWQKLDKKTRHPYAIAMRDGSLYSFAGLWDRWKDEHGQWLETFTIITTDPNELMQPLHTRMPVILPRHVYDRWLGSDANEDQRLPLDLLRPFPADQMTAWRVGTEVGNVRNVGPALLEEARAIAAAQPDICEPPQQTSLWDSPTDNESAPD